MSVLRLLHVFIFLGLFISACTRGEEQQQPVFQQSPELQEIKLEKPPKIKLKRDAKDGYSWEISGDNVDEVIKANKKLRTDLISE